MTAPPMSTSTTHDRTNLARLVRALGAPPAPAPVVDYADWLALQRALQKIKHARRLLARVREAGPAPGQDLSEIARTLDALEASTREAAQTYTPPKSRPAPLLPSIPTPAVRAPPPSTPAPTPGAESALLLGADALPAAADLLLTPSDARPPSPAPAAEPMPFTRQPSSSEQTKAVPAALQNSAAVQAQLGAELAQMATQLRANAERFRTQLADEKPLVDAAGDKLTENLTQLQGSRVRLRDRSKDARGTTCLVLAAVVGVLAAFVAMVLLIRVT